MQQPPAIAHTLSRLPVRITLAYALGAATWIVVSDWLLGVLQPPGSSVWSYVASLKGLLFVVVTALLLYKVMTRVLRGLQRAQADLRIHENRWRLALDTVGDGVWETDLNTRTTFYSRKWKSMLGYRDSEIGSDMDDWLELIHPADRVGVEEAMRRYLSGETGVYECEYRLRTKAGDYRWIMARGSFVQDEDGTPPTRIIGTHTDVTARKRLEDQKNDALGLVNAVIDHSPNGVIVYKASGPAVMANQAAARVVGTDVTGLLGQDFRKLDSWRDSLLPVAERALRLDREENFEGRLVSSYGAEIWLEAHFRPFEYQGEQHLLLLIQDESGKHLALEKLHLMQAAVEAAPVGWIVTDAAGQIEWVNPKFSAMTGFTAAEVVGKNPRILNSGQQSREYYDEMWRTITRGEVWSGEMINKRKDGEQYHEINTIAPLRNAAGTITHFVGIKQDRTEHNRLEQQLSRSQRLESIGQLATGMVHDLNNMLSPIMLALGLIRIQHSDAATQGHLRMMESAAQRAAGVLRQVLTFARGVDGERVQLEPKHLIKEVALLAEETFPRQIKVNVEVVGGVNLVSGDLTQLHQVLLNLAVNARDAMPEGGSLTLYADNLVVDPARAARQLTKAKPGDYVCLGVRDTGTGISREALEHMFEPFYTTKPHGKGTGLGLSTVFGIVRSHGGVIEVESKLGSGTDMRVLLPAVMRTDIAPRSVESAPEPLVGAGRRILVVDDEEAIREITCCLLERCGFVTSAARDGSEGLRILSADADRFAAVITDLMMPNMDGYQLAAEVRRLAPGLPILASTGMSGESPIEDEAALRALQIRTLLHKPYAQAELLEGLRRELGDDSRAPVEDPLAVN